MGNYKIALIQVWLGPFPDYFKYHLKTCEYQSNIDFLIFTDHEIKLKLPSNIKTFSITKSEIENKISKLVGSSIVLANNKKTCDLKATYGDLFKEYLTKYDYIGCYDIDTLLGDLYNWVNPYLGKYNFISTAVKTFHDRLSGPFLIWENKEELNTLYKNFNLIEILKQEEVSCFEEQEFSNYVINNYSAKLIYNSQNSDPSGKVIYEALWSGGKTYCNNKEILLHHFYYKNSTKLSFRGNSIISRYKKNYQDDFYWVSCFTKSYEPLAQVLINSIEKFSNRKCILYTINYNSDLAYKLSDQFIFRRLDIEPGEIDHQGRDFNMLNLKPQVNLDVLNFIPDSKFVFVDTDIHLTVNADSINKYFPEIENYPLINSHTHDKIYVSNLIPGEEWSSPIDILGEATEVPISIYPRRKTNLIIFDSSSFWFFQEQIDLYNEYKGTKPGIFALHDEDSANLVLNKYNLTKCLPLSDMEEGPTIDLKRFTNYKYSLSVNSENLVLPQHENDILVFHGFKTPQFENELKSNYLKTVFTQDEFITEYKNETFWWYRNSFLTDKNLQLIVRFEIIFNNQVIFTFNQQSIFNYSAFKIFFPNLDKGFYNVRIVEEETNRIIHSNIVQI